MLLYDFRQFAGAVVCIRTAVTARAREFASIADPKRLLPSGVTLVAAPSWLSRC
jgi:hypothetical protein